MKETISKVKRQPSEWEKIKANEATDKELISNKQLIYLNTPSPKKWSNQKWAKELNIHFSREDIQMAIKHGLHWETKYKHRVEYVTSTLQISAI